MSGTAGEATGADPSGTVWRTITLVVMAALGVVLLVALNWNLGEANRQTRPRARAAKAQLRSDDPPANLSGRSRAPRRRSAAMSSAPTPTWGQAYSADWTLAGQQVSRLDQITRDNPDQHALLGELLRVMARAATNCQASRSTRCTSATARRSRCITRRACPPPGTEIDDVLDRIGTRERELLAQRTGYAECSRSHARPRSRAPCRSSACCSCSAGSRWGG